MTNNEDIIKVLQKKHEEMEKKLEEMQKQLDTKDMELTLIRYEIFCKERTHMRKYIGACRHNVFVWEL